MNRRLIALTALPIAALTLGACSTASPPSSTGTAGSDAAACSSVRSIRTDRSALVDAAASGSKSAVEMAEAKGKIAMRLSGAAGQAASPELRDALQAIATAYATGKATPSPEDNAATATIQRMCP